MTPKAANSNPKSNNPNNSFSTATSSSTNSVFKLTNQRIASLLGGLRSLRGNIWGIICRCMSYRVLRIRGRGKKERQTVQIEKVLRYAVVFVHAAGEFGQEIESFKIALEKGEFR
jgi:hypothetical protein